MKWIKWAIENPVPINLVMVMLIILGLSSGSRIERELFPKFELDTIEVVVEMEGGSTPDQVDRNIVQVIQPRIQNIDGVKEILSMASESQARLMIQLESGYDSKEVKDEVKGEIDTIRTFPEQALDPRISILKHFERAISVAVYGDHVDPIELRQIADFVKSDLKAQGIVSRAELFAGQPMEVAIRIPRESLQSKGLSIEEVARVIQSYNIEQTGGLVRAEYNNILIKGDGRKTSVEELGEIPIRFPNGEFLSLKDLAGPDGIDDGFSEDPVILEFNGQRAVVIQVEKGDSEDLIELCDGVKEYLAGKSLPNGVQMAAFRDLSLLVKDRLSLILRNGAAGLVLVLLTLSLFLEWRVAFWVAAGIAVSLVGSLVLLMAIGGTINMLTLFGFLMTTGIVVDDAIVVGESFFSHQKEGMSGEEVAERAMEEVSSPVLAMVSTTLIAFLPLLFVSGLMGDFIRIIPSVVLCALALSLFESLFILPTHLAHHSGREPSRFLSGMRVLFFPLIWISKHLQPRVNALLDDFAERALLPLIRLCIHHRYSVCVLFFSALVFLFGLIPAGWVKVELFPRPDTEFYEVKVEFERGTPIAVTQQAAHDIREAFKRTGEFFRQASGEDPTAEQFVEIGGQGSNLANLMVRLKSVEEGRVVSGQEFLDQWRKEIPLIPNLLSVEFSAQSGGPPSKAVELWLTSNDDAAISTAEGETLKFLKSIQGTVDVNTDNKPGALTLEVKLLEEYRNLDNAEAEIIRTLSNAYQGIKVDTFYRGDNEIKMWVRHALDDRKSLSALKELQLPSGVRIGQVAQLEITREEAEIRRVDGERTITVSSEVDLTSGANASEVRQKLEKDFLRSFPQKFPLVRWKYSGESKEGAEAIDSMIHAYIPALFGIYLVLATIFSSYLQPFIIMFAIPFAFVGSIMGHYLMGISINLLSLFGIVALTGIAVNDSLVLIDYINLCRRRGVTLNHSLVLASKRRLRPILLTSLTTIAGMSPILFETSFQAQFLIPMVTSIVFGVAVATVLILVLIPVGYKIMDDLIELLGPKTRIAGTVQPERMCRKSGLR